MVRYLSQGQGAPSAGIRCLAVFGLGASLVGRLRLAAAAKLSPLPTAALLLGHCRVLGLSEFSCAQHAYQILLKENSLL